MLVKLPSHLMFSYGSIKIEKRHMRLQPIPYRQLVNRLA